MGPSFSKVSNILSPHKNDSKENEFTELSKKKSVEMQPKLEKQVKEIVDRTFAQKIEDNLEMITEKIVKERQSKWLLF